MPRPEQHFITGIIDRLKAGARATFTMDIVGRANENGFAPCPLIGIKQIVGENLGAAGMQIGMIMSQNHDARVHAFLRGFSAIRKSW